MSDAREGKRAVRNWANLPPEVLRLVVANYLAYKPHAFVPAAWLHPDFHYQRTVFETLRDAYDVERIMRVCPQWHHSLLNMDFWIAACRKFDRTDALYRQMMTTQQQRDFVFLQQSYLQEQQQEQHQQQEQQQAVGLTHTSFRRSFHHFHTLTRSCCLPCRINRPLGKDGIGNVKASIATAHFGQVPICKHHRVNYFCGVCLKDVTLASEGDHAQYAKVPESLFENEDTDTWPLIHTTCFHCRREALLRAVIHYTNTTPIDLYNFVGGAAMEPKDYEARSTIENFVDMAEGGVNDVINILLERHWLQSNTNLGSLLDQAVASARYSRAEIDGYETEDDMLSDDEEDSYDMLQIQEENGIRLLAVTAWARSRIMDGNWVTPNDLWCMGMGQLPHDSSWDPSVLPPTLHPVPYWLQTSPSDQRSPSISGSEENNGEDASVLALSIIDHSFTIHYPTPDRFMPLPSYRFVQLTSACFRNTLREILFEPLRRLVYQLALEAQAVGQDPCLRLGKVGLDDVLAMLRDEKLWYVVSHGNARLAHHIPYIPVSTENMAPMTKSLLENLWREACAPLYQCRCSICDRALQKQAQVQGQRSSLHHDDGLVLATSPVQSPVTRLLSRPEEKILLEDEDEKISDKMDNGQDVVMNVDVTMNATLTPSDNGFGSVSDPESNRSRKRSSASVDEDEDEVDHQASPRSGKSVILGDDSAVNLPRKKRRTMSSDDMDTGVGGGGDDGDEDDYASVEMRETLIVDSSVSSEERKSVHPSSSPSSSIFSSLSSGSESGLSSSPLSTSSDTSSLHSVASGPPPLANRVALIKSELDVAVAPGSGGVLGDSVKIRGKDDSPTNLLYDEKGVEQQHIERYYT